jgi:hypothetical protein
MGARLMEEILIQMFYNRFPLDCHDICTIVSEALRRPIGVFSTMQCIEVLLEEGHIREVESGWYIITNRNECRFGLSGMELAREHWENRLFVCYMLCKEYGIPPNLSKEERLEFNLRQSCFGEF